jgi:hypothetical protein
VVASFGINLAILRVATAVEGQNFRKEDGNERRWITYAHESRHRPQQYSKTPVKRDVRTIAIVVCALKRSERGNYRTGRSRGGGCLLARGSADQQTYQDFSQIGRSTHVILNAIPLSA